MSALLRDLWEDEAGLILSAEMVIILTIAVLGMVVGLSNLQGAILGEFNDLSFAFHSLNQSYATPTFRGCWKYWGPTSWKPGSSFVDLVHDDLLVVDVPAGGAVGYSGLELNSGFGFYVPSVGVGTGGALAYPGVAIGSIESLTIVQIQALTVFQIQSLTVAQIQAFSGPQLQAFAVVQIQALTPWQIQALTASQVAALTGLQIQSLTPFQIQTLSTAQIQSLTVSQIASLAGFQIQALTTRQIQAFTTVQIQALTSLQIQALTTEQVQALTPAQKEAFSASQLEDLSRTRQPTSRMEIDQILKARPNSTTAPQLPPKPTPTPESELPQIQDQVPNAIPPKAPNLNETTAPPAVKQP